MKANRENGRGMGHMGPMGRVALIGPMGPIGLIGPMKPMGRVRLEHTGPRRLARPMRTHSGFGISAFGGCGWLGAVALALAVVWGIPGPAVAEPVSANAENAAAPAESAGASGKASPAKVSRASVDPARVAALMAVGDSLGARFAGAAWLPDGPAFADGVAEVPMARFLRQVRAAGAVAATGRWLSGLPLPPEGWRKVMAGPALLIWMRPVEYGAFENLPKSESSAGDAKSTPSDFATTLHDSAPDSPPSRLPEKAERNTETALLISLDPKDPGEERAILRWLATDGFHLARGNDPGLVARRRRVGGSLIHSWRRVDVESADTAQSRAGAGRRGGVADDASPAVLAYAIQNHLLILSGDERVVSQILLHKGAGASASADATTRDDATSNAAAHESPLTSHLLHAIDDAARLGAPMAAVFEVHAFPLFESADWIGEGLGIGLVGRLADQLAAHDEKTSAVIARTREGAAWAGERVRAGGISDLDRLEMLYWPDEKLPRSRIRLVFKPGAATWMEELAAGRPFRVADHAPADCVAFWTMRVPQRLLGKDAEQGGAEIGRVFVPTSYRVASVWAVEAPSANAFLRAQMTKADDYFSTRTLEMPVKIPLAGPWAKVKGALAAVEPWMPLLGVRWKVRLVGDFMALSSSFEALDKLGAVDRGKAKSLREARPELFESMAAMVETPSGTGAASVSDLGPGRMAFERYNDIAFRAESTRALDIVEFPFLSDPDQDAKLFQVNYLALAQKIPKVKEWLATLPPQHTRVMWYPEAETVEVSTQSASGLPGDPRVWASAGASLFPTFNLDVSGWDLGLSVERLKSIDLEKFDPRRWFSEKEAPPPDEMRQPEQEEPAEQPEAAPPSETKKPPKRRERPRP